MKISCSTFVEGLLSATLLHFVGGTDLQIEKLFIYSDSNATEIKSSKCLCDRHYGNRGNY